VYTQNEDENVGAGEQCIQGNESVRMKPHKNEDTTFCHIDYQNRDIL